MQTRRDQLHAYRFLTKRALAALVTGEPNAVEPPMRRLTLTTVSGVMIAVLVGVGVVVFGLIKPSAGDSWKDSTKVIIERQTGDHFIYSDGKLDPVVNYTSAVLAVSGQGSSTSAAGVVLVDSGEIAGVPQGPTLGINDVPDSLPSASDIVNSPWIVCSRQHAQSATTLQASVSVTIGTGVLTPSYLGADQAILVNTPHALGTDYLLWDGQRFKIPSETITSALGIDDNTPLTVGTAFLQSLDAGPTLDTPPIAGLNDPAGTIDGHPVRVGQLIRDETSHQDSVVLSDGVQSVSSLEAALLRTVDAPPELALPSNVIVNAKQSSSQGAALLNGPFRGLPTDLPDVAGEPDDVGDACAVFTDDVKAHPRLATVPTLLPNFPVNTVNESSRSASGEADSVTISAGHVALVKSGDRSPTVFAVTSPGKKYAFASPALIGAFGYSSTATSVIPGQLLPLVPDGAALDPKAARTPVSG